MPPKAAAAQGLRSASPQPGGSRHAGTGRFRTAGTAVAAALAVTAVVVAFAAGFRTPDSDQATLRGFQIRVLSISQAAAENRMDGALAALLALESDLDAAAREGRISASRLRGIEKALEAVRTDLDARLAPAAGVVEPAAPGDAAGTATAGGGQAQAVPGEPVPAAPVAVPQPSPAGVGGQRGDLPAAAQENSKGKGRP